MSRPHSCYNYVVHCNFGGPVSEALHDEVGTDTCNQDAGHARINQGRVISPLHCIVIC